MTVESTTHEFSERRTRKIVANAKAGDRVYYGKGVAGSPTNTVPLDEDMKQYEVRQALAVRHRQDRARRRLRDAVNDLAAQLRARGLDLRAIGPFWHEVVPLSTTAPTTNTARCVACGGQIWCGACRRCGTRP